jgi:hypothetical protein
LRLESTGIEVYPVWGGQRVTGGERWKGDSTRKAEEQIRASIVLDDLVDQWSKHGLGDGYVWGKFRRRRRVAVVVRARLGRRRLVDELSTKVRVNRVECEIGY